MNIAKYTMVILFSCSFLLSCASNEVYRFYEGPERPADQVAFLVNTMQGYVGFEVMQVDRTPVSFCPRLALAPGTHSVYVVYNESVSAISVYRWVDIEVSAERSYAWRTAFEDGRLILVLVDQNTGDVAGKSK